MPIALILIYLLCAYYKNTTVQQAIIFIYLSLELFQLYTLLFSLGSHLGHLTLFTKPIDNLHVALAYLFFNVFFIVHAKCPPSHLCLTVVWS
jgi:hypothetical protein